jgi:hypothetical protein
LVEYSKNYTQFGKYEDSEGSSTSSDWHFNLKSYWQSIVTLSTPVLVCHTEPVEVLSKHRSVAET